MTNSKRPFKILSIDGGGIKGIFSSTILEVFENTFQCKAYEHFDMLCGTSTGGLIALALSAGKSASDISRIYENHGPDIFPQKWNRTFRQIFHGGKYTNKHLKTHLHSMFGDLKLEDSNNLLCIPSYNYTEAKPCVFKFDHREGRLHRDHKISYVDVALATSAAPTYFPIHEIASVNKQYIDGGVWANNPSLVGIVDALCYFVGPDKPYDSIELLSIGSIEIASGKPLHKKINRSVLDWKLHVLNPYMKGQLHFSHNALNLLCKHGNLDIKYRRVGSPELSSSQKKQVGMDKVNRKVIELMIGLGRSKAEEVYRDKEIEEFFETKKTYNTQNL